MKGVFLDRDGVINQNRSKHVLDPAHLRFLPGSLDGLAKLASGPFRIVVVTNQSAIGRGHLTRAQLEAIHARLLTCVHSSGGRIDAIYVCPHRPDAGCSCRKPGTALLARAAAELDLDLGASYFVGDAASDVRAALAAGCQPVLVLTGRGRRARFELLQDYPGHYWVRPDLRAAVDLILARERHASGGSGEREIGLEQRGLGPNATTPGATEVLAGNMAWRRELQCVGT